MIELEAFRAKVRGWLDDNADSYKSFDAADTTMARAFRTALWDAGLLGITLDESYGGQGLTPEHQKVWEQEAARFRLPAIGEPVTTGICAPNFMHSLTRNLSLDR